MPRPKGSHNKPKNLLVSELEQSVENIDERIAEAEKAIEILKTDLKAKKAELKELTKLKERAETVAAAKKAEEDKEAILSSVAASGKSVEEILELLK
jgi:flagellar biosynthesis chaperone FliJ